MSRQSDMDNHANQCNPNNDAYWDSRGEDKPDGWDEQIDRDDPKSSGKPTSNNKG